MSSNWKPLAVIAGGAFLLSLLTGILGRVGFGTAFLRAVIWAIVFGGLAFGVEFVLRQYFPGLLPEEAADVEKKAVDITLEDENPHASSGAHDSDSDTIGSTGEGAGEAAGEAAGGDDISRVASAPLAGQDDDGFGDEKADDVEELESVPGSGTGGPEEPGTPAGSGLPSFDGVESTFTASEPTGGATMEATNVDILGAEEDPEVVARAVRTLMNKDQEG